MTIEEAGRRGGKEEWDKAPLKEKIKEKRVGKKVDIWEVT